MKIKTFKRDGNKIETMDFKNEEDFKNGKWCSWGSRSIREVNMNKSYVDELYCRNICGNYYCFGCDWDKRCNKDNKPIHQVVSECPKFLNAMEVAEKLIEKMESDKDFKRFCEIANANMNFAKTKWGRQIESKLEVLIGIYNGNKRFKIQK